MGREITLLDPVAAQKGCSLPCKRQSKGGERGLLDPLWQHNKGAACLVKGRAKGARVALWTLCGSTERSAAKCFLNHKGQCWWL
eukprot:scaffold33949_cov21-Tisochrysis_lutea.AAC.1